MPTSLSVRDSLRKITSSSRHLLSLINEVLDMSKIESGRISLNEEEFSLSALVDDLVVVMQRLAGHGAGFAVCFALRRKEMACKSVHLFVFRAKPAHSLVY